MKPKNKAVKIYWSDYCIAVLVLIVAVGIIAKIIL